MKNKKAFGSIILLITSIIWGLAFVFQRTGMDKIEPITFNAVRMATGAIFLGIVILLLNVKSKKTSRASTENNRKTIIGGLCCGAFLSAASLAQQIGMVYTSAGKAGFITAMYILFVPIINFVIFKKKAAIKVWVAVLIGILGMYMLCVKESFTFTLGDVMILACAIIFSGHILCVDYFTQFCDPIKLSAIQFATAAVVSTVFAFVFESPTVEKIISAAIPILYCGILSGGVGYTLQMVGQKDTDPAIASLIMSLESVFALIAGVLLLGETMTFTEIAGCVIMFAAIVLAQLPEKKKT